MSDRLATDDEINTWADQGWVVLKGLIDRDTIAAAAADLWDVFPTAETYHADPDGTRRRYLGIPPERDELYVWPPEGPGFRPAQHNWHGDFPLPGTGALNRLFVHPSIVDFMRRALQTTDLRMYQAGVSAKYTGETNYEQPMHTDRNHSWLPAKGVAPWWHVESFLYLSDVDMGTAPTHLVRLKDSVGRATTVPLVLPQWDPELYAAELPAIGVAGSLLAYRPDVFHRAVNLTEPGGARFLLNVSYRGAGQDWVGYHVQQSNATSPDWVTFVEGSTPDQLSLLGFPPPGHAIWDADLLDATAERYPRLDLAPWRAALA
jgi:hypothetical protein